ncbi:MAG: secondary thiamine-phosphate synthase enzyme YjbQ [Gammaproteobacteria bacterium]
MGGFFQRTLSVDTAQRGTYEITRDVEKLVDEAGSERGLCNLFIAHTSASLIVTENADPDVRRDLETIFEVLVPDGDPRFIHDAEGPDDMPAHVRSVLTQTSLNIPIIGGKLGLGAWQGVFVWEHRTRPHRRRVVVSIQG